MSELLLHSQELQRRIMPLLSHIQPDSEMNYDRKTQKIEIKFTHRPGWFRQYLGHINISQNSLVANFAPPQGIDINTVKISEQLEIQAKKMGISQPQISFDTQSKQVA